MKPVMQQQSSSIERQLFEQECALDDARRADAARDRQLAVLSHELKQPLAELLLNAERLLQPTVAVDPRKLRAIGEAVRGVVRRQVRIIDDLLELSRLRTGKLRLDPVPVDVAALVRAACVAAAAGAPRVTLDVDIRYAGESLCMVDPVRVEQILSNLLGNAIKFSDGGGRVSVQLAVDQGCARIAVADAGCGIAAEFLPHVFGMFGQERRPGTPANAGLGIGLALVRELALAHGGRVEARSDGPGRGAQFLVWLPLLDAAARRGGVACLPAVAHPDSPRRIGARQATR